MVVVVVPGLAEDWAVSNRAFDLLVNEALLLTTQPEDRQRLLLLAQANHALFLDHLDLVDQRRIAEALATATRLLRRRLMENTEPSAWETSFITYLPVLEMYGAGYRP